MSNLNATTGDVCFVYLITCRDGSVYVGKSLHPEKRWKAHQKAALKNSNAIPHLYNAIRKYGVESFTFLIESSHASENAAFEREKELISQFRIENKNLYNVSSGGRGGIKYTIEQRKTHSEIQKAWSSTEQARMKNSLAQQRESVRHAKSIGMKKVWTEDETYKEQYMNRVQSQENREKYSRILSSSWSDPEKRQRLLEGMRNPQNIAFLKKRTSNEGNPRSKLTWVIVDRIRAAYASGSTVTDLCKEFSLVSECTIRRVITNRAWVKESK